MSSLLLLKSMIISKAIHKTKKKKEKKKSKLFQRDKNLAHIKCRTCYGGKAHIPIFNNILLPNISEEIYNFSGVVITQSDKFSKFMCKICLDLLNGCILFREYCQKSDKEFAHRSKRICHTSNPIFPIDDTVKSPAVTEQFKIESNCKEESDDSYNVPSPTFSEPCDEEKLSPQKEAISESETKEPPDEHPRGKKRKWKSFLCEICGKTAYSNAGLGVHMLTHGNEFPWKCEQCPYQGRTLDLLKVHQKSHLAEKPYKCPHCPKATTTSSNLKKHMNTHSTTRSHRCTYCEKMFMTQHDLKRHVRDIHLRQGYVECDICYKKFNTKKILRGHQLKIHKIKSERSGRLPSYLLSQMQDPPQPTANINFEETC